MKEEKHTSPLPSAPGPNGDLSIQFREFDLALAEAELRLSSPETTAALESLQKARLVTEETLNFKFSI